MGNIKSVYVSIPAFEIATKTNGWLYAQLQSALRNELSDYFGAIESFSYQEVGFSEDEQTVMFKVSIEIPDKRNMTMTIQELLDNMPRIDLLHLYFDAQILHKTGILQKDAGLRKLTEEVFGESTVLHMTTISYNIYRKIAELYMDTND